MRSNHVPNKDFIALITQCYFLMYGTFCISLLLYVYIVMFVLLHDADVKTIDTHSIYP